MSRVGGYVSGVSMSRDGGYPRFHGIPTPTPEHETWHTPPSGGHQNTCGWQAGGMHPTGMLTCFILGLDNPEMFLRIC